MAMQGRNTMGAVQSGLAGLGRQLKPMSPQQTVIPAQKPLGTGMPAPTGMPTNTNYQARTPPPATPQRTNWGPPRQGNGTQPSNGMPGGPGQNRQGNNGGGTVVPQGSNNGQPQTAPAPTPTPAPAQPGYSDVLTGQFGQGNPFGMQSWYGGNPLQTAATMAQRKLDENLAQLRARYGAQGLGASSRLGLAEGQAIGDTMTGLGDVLAQRGQQAYASDASRGLEALMGAGSQDLQSRQLGLQANQQLMNAGTALTGIGQGEQSIPNLDSLLSYITNMANTNTFGQVAMAGHGK